MEFLYDHHIFKKQIYDLSWGCISATQNIFSSEETTKFSIGNLFDYYSLCESFYKEINFSVEPTYIN